MKTSLEEFKLLDNRELIEDIFHELKSILSSILSSVELIGLYGDNGDKPVNGKITRQAGAIKSQVIELEFQLQNLRIIQHVLNNSLEPRRQLTDIVFFLKNLVQDELYQELFSSTVTFQVNKEQARGYIDELLMKQLVLNMFFWMIRNSPTHQQPRLTFTVQEPYFEIKGRFASNYGNYDQRNCYLIAYITELHNGDFDIIVESEKDVEILVRIPYGKSLLK
jgi:hypothetical protein